MNSPVESAKESDMLGPPPDLAVDPSLMRASKELSSSAAICDARHSAAA